MRKIGFLLTMVPLALLALLLLLLNFGTMPRTDLTTALAVVILVAVVAIPAGITVWGFAVLMDEQRRGRRKRP